MNRPTPASTWQPISPDLSREHAGKPTTLPALTDADAAKRRGAIYSLAASYQNKDTLWAGTDDGLLWITHDHGKNWKNITPPSLSPWSKVTQISASHFDDNTAYVSVSRFRIDDLHPYLFRTRDSGATWEAITAGLPENSPVNTVREDPVRKGLLFAGTERSVWFSLDDGAHWQSLQLNLPHTSMRDLWIKDNDLIVATHGRSFWILDDISPLRQLTAANTQQATLFHPGDAYRVRRSTNPDTPIPVDEPFGENPPDGAAIDYFLPQSVTGAVTLHIADEHGQIVRQYSSEDKPYATSTELDKQLIPLYWLRMPTVLSAQPGMHRWVWDLHYAQPTATHYEYPISAVPHDTPREPQGPLALPGSYTVRLTVNGHAITAPLTVKMDPRVPASSADLSSLFDLEKKLAEMVSQSSEASLQAHSIQEQLAKVPGTSKPALARSLPGWNKSLTALLDGNKASDKPDEPGLDDEAEEAGALYEQVSRADAKPTAAQVQTAAHANEELSRTLLAWEQFKTTSLPEINRQLRAEHLTELNLELKPEIMPQGGDED